MPTGPIPTVARRASEAAADEDPAGPAATHAGTDGRATDRTAALRVAYLIDVFPRPSNTFIVDQIVGVAQLGHDVDIFARSIARDGLRHEGLERLGLPDRMRHIPVPDGHVARVLGLLRATAETPSLGPTMARQALGERFRPGSLTRLYTALSFLRAGPFDVVHCQFGTLGPMAVSMRRTGALRGAVVTSFRGADATRSLREDPHGYDQLFRDGDLFLPVSTSLRTRLLDAGCPSERTVVHHSGIHVDGFPFTERRRTTGEPLASLFVGRLTEKKGIHHALEALALLRREGREVRLDVAGEGEERTALEAKARTLGIAADVRFLGPLTPSQVATHMRRAHILVAPSTTAADGDQEGIPNVLKEAMATGLPVLSTFHSGIPELVENGVSGLLAPERDAVELARLWAVLDDHPERWPAMGRAGRSAVEEGFDAGKLAADLIALYRTAAASRAGGTSA